MRAPRAPGFYWVQISEDDPPEVARLTEAGEWMITAPHSTISEEESDSWWWIADRRLPPPRVTR